MESYFHLYDVSNSFIKLWNRKERGFMCMTGFVFFVLHASCPALYFSFLHETMIYQVAHCPGRLFCKQLWIPEGEGWLQPLGRHRNHTICQVLLIQHRLIYDLFLGIKRELPYGFVGENCNNGAHEHVELKPAKSGPKTYWSQQIKERM